MSITVHEEMRVYKGKMAAYAVMYGVLGALLTAVCSDNYLAFGFSAFTFLVTPVFFVVFQFLWNRPVVSLRDGVLTVRTRLCHLARRLSDCRWSFTTRPNDVRLGFGTQVIRIDALCLRRGKHTHGPIVYCGFEPGIRSQWEGILVSEIGMPNVRLNLRQFWVVAVVLLVVPAITILVFHALSVIGVGGPVARCVTGLCGSFCAMAGMLCVAQHSLAGVARWFLVVLCSWFGLLLGVGNAYHSVGLGDGRAVVVCITAALIGHMIGLWTGALAQRDSSVLPDRA